MLTAIEALRALDSVVAPYSVYVVNRVRERNRYLTHRDVRRALTEAEANGWCKRGHLKHSYGYSWKILPAGRAALEGEIIAEYVDAARPQESDSER